MLITKELEKRFKEVGDQSGASNPIVVAKLFNPCGAGTWYLTAYEPETRIAFGYVTGLCEDEWGSISIDEIENVNLPFGLKIERDLYFKEQTFKDLQL
jgi:hypothetical protein